MQNNWSWHSWKPCKMERRSPVKKDQNSLLLQESAISFTVNLTAAQCSCQKLDVSKRNSCRNPNYVSEVELGTKRGFFRVYLHLHLQWTKRNRNEIIFCFLPQLKILKLNIDFFLWIHLKSTSLAPSVNRVCSHGKSWKRPRNMLICNIGWSAIRLVWRSLTKTEA